MHCSPSALPSSFSRRCGQHTADRSINCAWRSDVRESEVASRLTAVEEDELVSTAFSEGDCDIFEHFAVLATASLANGERYEEKARVEATLRSLGGLPGQR